MQVSSRDDDGACLTIKPPALDEHIITGPNELQLSLMFTVLTLTLAMQVFTVITGNPNTYLDLQMAQFFTLDCICDSDSVSITLTAGGCKC